jgi:hypothetical protein
VPEVEHPASAVAVIIAASFGMRMTSSHLSWIKGKCPLRRLSCDMDQAAAGGTQRVARRFRSREEPTMTDDAKPTTETPDPNLSTDHQRAGDARRPSDTLDKGQPQGETIPRKSSLLGND